MSPRMLAGPYCIRLAISVLVAIAASACANRPVVVPAASAPPPTRDIETLIERGCFECLQQALQLAETGKVRSLLFEAATLLALRATELGMPADDYLAKARSVVEDDAARTEYLEMVAAVPPDPMRGLRDDLLFETQARKRIETRLTSVPSWFETLQTGTHSEIFRRYLEVSLICSVDRRPDRFDRLEALRLRTPRVPLLDYRFGICDDRYHATLRAVRADVPEFVDADYALGQYALRDPERPDQDVAMRLYRSAAAAFPTSTAIPTVIGNLYQTWEDWPNALTAYDQALALLPSHPDALIGRVIALSQLDRNDEAIASATQLIDAGRWHLGQALYWRAWNYFGSGNTQAARSDADRTRTLMVNPSVFLLSGLIEWRLLRRETSEAEFQEALKMDFGQCEAAFYLGGVRAEMTKLPEAIAAMQQARQCYDLALAVRRKLFDQAMSAAATPEQKAREATRHGRAIAAVQKRRDEVVVALERLQRAQTSVDPVAPISRQPPRAR